MKFRRQRGEEVGINLTPLIDVVFLLLIFFMVGMLATAFGLTILGNHPMSYGVIMCGNGVIWGLWSVLIGVTWPRFYGLKNLGAISGYSLSWTVIGSALGPYLFSLSADLTGSYDLVGWVCIGLSILLLLLSFKADNPSEIL